jgi:D-glycero-D-manno-heptose 1,7-bisphosphate phosphatase
MAGRSIVTRPAVFLDRDGTILDELGYVTPGKDIAIYPFSATAIAKLTAAGFPVVVITNQGGIALGLYDHAFVDDTHAWLDATLKGEGASITAWYYCPHHPDGKVAEFTHPCDCRKPATGMLDAAARDWGLDLAASWVVGDQWRDVELAHRAGARSVLVRTGYGRGLEGDWPAKVARPTIVCDDLLAAAEHIVNSDSMEARPRGHPGQ